ncbi:MAG TPA: hypothetical protein DCY13_09730 [Verrucomicrobiales bacterium]|nr:hypothetical protein [Verrucomicrobiales bacterium]
MKRTPRKKSGPTKKSASKSAKAVAAKPAGVPKPKKSSTRPLPATPKKGKAPVTGATKVTTKSTVVASDAVRATSAKPISRKTGDAAKRAVKGNTSSKTAATRPGKKQLPSARPMRKRTEGPVRKAPVKGKVSKKKKAEIGVAAPKKSTPTPTPRVADKGRAKTKLPKVPPLLLEGDYPPDTLPGGPGSRYALGVAAGDTIGGIDDLALPESYGTRKLWLVARDPQWLYARWDLSREQLGDYNQLSRDGHLLLRVYDRATPGEALTEIHVHPESKSWFAHVGRGGGSYFAVLGFRDKLGDWHEVSRSSAVSTPPDSLSDNLEAEFANLPSGISFTDLIQVIRKYVAGEPALVKAIEQLRASGRVDLPELPPPAEFINWSPRQQQALAELITMEEVRRVWAGSQEITELIKGQRERALASAAAVPLPEAGAAGAIGAIGAISSPRGGAKPGARGFWFNVNAELVIYGATEPDAAVTIGGRPIRLRKDGTFSYRFALPDGNYSLPASATSADGVETRRAGLWFSRDTSYQGDVGAHPQESSLKPPSPANVE